MIRLSENINFKTIGLLITVYGFGEVGSLVAELFNSNFSNCTLNVMNTKEHVSDRILDFQHAAACNNKAANAIEEIILNTSE